MMLSQPNSSVDDLWVRPVAFLSGDAPGDDIAISSRIRLARNISQLPFPGAADEQIMQLVTDKVETALFETQALGGDMLAFDVSSLSKLDGDILFERRLASRELLSREQGAALLVSSDERASIMVNEEDHLRMQAIRPGFQLQEAWKDIDAIDSKLSEYLDFAYDEKLGFMTACPTNVGTGIRVSVMLHLPGLMLDGQMPQVESGLAKLGLTVRGIFGEGSDNRGNLYQISNQSTLGETEGEIIDRISRIIEQLIMHEKNARHKLLESDQYKLFDRVGRCYGLLRHSYILNSEEACDSLSGARFGVDMKMFSSIDLEVVNNLFTMVLPAHLQKMAGQELSGVDRDVFRAQWVRDQLKQSGA